MKQLFSRFYFYIGKLKLRNKLLFSYLIFLFIPMCFFTTVTFQRFSAILKNDIMTSIEHNYGQTYSYLSDKTEKIENTSNIILTSADINNVFSLQINEEWQAKNYYLVKQSMNFLSSLEDKDIDRVILFLFQNDTKPELSYSFRSISNVSDSKWYNIITHYDLSQLWCPTYYLRSKDSSLSTFNKSDYALIRNFNCPSDFSKKLGYYCIYFSAKEINAIINQADAVDGSVTFLLNSQGELVYTSSQQQYSALYPGFANKTEVNKLSAGLSTYTYNGKKEIFAQKILPDTDWDLITIVPSDDIFSRIRSMQLSIMLMTFILSILCMLFAWKVSNSITQRITLLKSKMKQVEQGVIAPLSETYYTDEIGMLYKSYNFMINEIKRLMQEEYAAGIQAKTAEMRALQAQINPHFLYNTLDTIKWLVQKENKEEAEKAISALATFYRLSLSKGNDEIPLEDELKQVYSYVQIENIRFSGGIILIYDMEEEITQYFVPKLILQPFVENSILHGIMNTESRKGSIIIKAVIENDMLKISIYDDGDGMSKDMIEMLNTESLDEDKGYGIKNVQRRIRLYCGPQYGVHFSRLHGSGTIVNIFLPVKREE